LEDETPLRAACLRKAPQGSEVADASTMLRGAANVVESRREETKLMRMRAFFMIALMALGAVAVLSQGAAVPISEEHHHHLIIENSYVKAYEVEVPPHESTLLHRHDYDYVYIVFGDADITNAVEGKQEVKAHLVDNAVNFVKGPFAHVAGNVGDTPFRNITISLLHKQGEVHIYYPTVAAALEANARQRNRFGGTILLETDDMRVVAATLPPHYVEAVAGIPPARLIIFPDRMNDASAPKEKSAPTFPSGLLKWYANGGLLNDSQKEMRVVWLDFKERVQ
jgi:hypothetical protein